MVLRITTFIVILYTLVSGALGGGFDDADKGPLSFIGQTPLQTLRLDIVPTRYNILEPNQVEWSIFNAWSNRWNKSDEFTIDVEMIQNILGLSVGIGGGHEVGFSIPVLTRTGGILDRFIIDFHDFLHLSQDGRKDYPLNGLSVRYHDDRTGQWHDLLGPGDAGTVLGDLSIFSRSQVYTGDGWLRSLLLTVLFRFPTSTERNYYGSGGTDAAFSLSSRHYLDPLYIYTTVGYGMFGSGSRAGVDLRPYQWTFFGAVEWPVSRNFSLILQEMTNSGTAKAYYDFHSPTYELIFGAKQYLSSRLMLEYGLMENLFNFENSTDFGVNFGLTFRL